MDNNCDDNAYHEYKVLGDDDSYPESDCVEVLASDNAGVSVNECFNSA